MTAEGREESVGAMPPKLRLAPAVRQAEQLSTVTLLAIVDFTLADLARQPKVGKAALWHSLREGQYLSH
jgi:hypothetical protein